MRAILEGYKLFRFQEHCKSDAKGPCHVQCRASLYERPVNLEAAKKAHTEFRRTMRAAGLKVLTIRDILSFGVDDHMGARVELEELATRALQFQLAEGVKMEEFHDKVAFRQAAKEDCMF